MGNSQRFTILKKWQVPFSVQAGVSTAFGRVIKSINLYKKLNLPVEYSSTTGAITEIRSNNLFLLAGAADDDLISCQGFTRIRYSDN